MTILSLALKRLLRPQRPGPASLTLALGLGAGAMAGALTGLLAGAPAAGWAASPQPASAEGADKPAASTAAPAPAPIADFFRDPQMQRPRLSPDGRAVAFVANPKGDNSVLAVMELDQGRQIRVLAGFDDAAIGELAWVGSQRLVYTAATKQAGRNSELHNSGLWVVRRDGSHKRPLIHTRYGADDQTSSRIASRTLSAEWELAGVPDDDSLEVWVSAPQWDGSEQLRSRRLSRLNVDDQRSRAQDEGLPLNSVAYWPDAGGTLWALQTLQRNQTEVRLKNAAGQWQVWRSGDLFNAPPPTPLAADGRGLYLVSAPGPAGTQAVYRLQPDTLAMEDKPLVSSPHFDLAPQVVFDPTSRRLLGLHFETEAPTSVWFDPTLRQWQQHVDQALPGRVNHLECQRCLSHGRVLVSSFSDTQPPEYYLFEREGLKLSLLGSSRPWMRAQDQAQRDLLRFAARDGLEIPVMVTRPRQPRQGPWPTVMLVHGGPYVRGTEWPWQALPQFLASRGYLVVEPEFRGSTGYGQTLFRAGWKQWGLAMQDDISDALAWAARQGWADPRRACIAGASYGGYAVLMGLIKDPQQYRCGVSWVGVTDIDFLSRFSWSDASEVWRTYGMTAMVGDPVADAEQLRRTSPVRRAAEITQPLLLAYGGADRRVPIEHGSRFKAALEASGHKQLEYVVYADEGHGWRKLATEEDFYGRMERFLARHLGASAQPR